MSVVEADYIVSKTDSIIEIRGDVLNKGPLTVSDTTNSVSTSTGAIVVSSGGIGVAQNLYVGGSTSVLATTASSSTSTGALLVSGGVGVADNLYVGGKISGEFDIVHTVSASFTGATLITCTLKFYKMGDMCFLQFGRGVGSPGTVAQYIITAPGVVPASMRPATGFTAYCPCCVFDGDIGDVVPAAAAILDTGEVRISTSAYGTAFTPFGGTGNEWWPMLISWVV